MKTWITFLLILGVNTMVSASDIGGKFAVRNAGMVDCQRFLEEKAKQSPQFQQIAGWMDGYLTAANVYEKDTYDLAPWGDSLFLVTLLDSHCQNHKTEKFYLAVRKMVSTLYKFRQKKESEKIEITNNELSVFIPQDLLVQVQSYLIEEKVLSGKADGQYGPKTRKALEKFQVNNKLTVTGLPDNLTLYLMFVKLYTGT